MILIPAALAPCWIRALDEVVEEWVLLYAVLLRLQDLGYSEALVRPDDAQGLGRGHVIGQVQKGGRVEQE